MQCPQCTSTDTYVINSRKSGEHRRRRRKCSECKHKFSTMEILVKTKRDNNDIAHKLQTINKLMDDMKKWIELNG